MWIRLLSMATLLMVACGDAPSEAAPEVSASPDVSAAPEVSAPPAPPAFETPPVLEASEILPAELVKGADFSVDPKVHNDGFMNRFLLRTSWGNLEVVSTPLLRKRVHEARALRHIDELSKSKEFAANLGEAGKGALRGAKNLVTAPVDTVSGAASGVGKLFGMAKAGVSGDDRQSETEDTRWKQATGYSQTKRNYAKEMGIDVYSRNPLLQKALDDLAWAGWAGGVTGGLAMMAIPGGAGIAVSVSKNTDLLNRIDVTRPPSEVRKDNRAKLTAMGMPAAAVGRFIDDSSFSPTEQSIITVSLEDMNGTEGRGDFLAFATAAPDPDVARFALLQARMYAQYHRKHEPIERFQRFGARLVARTADGSVVVLHPTDYLFWTEALAGIGGGVTPQLGDAPGKLLWVGIRASDAARKGLAANGWEVREGELEALLPD
jgi:hypothetical protein